MYSLKDLLLEGVNSNTKIITNAIKDSKFIKFFYSGDDNNKPGYRTVEPYVLGYTKAKNLAFRCWILPSSVSGSAYGKGTGDILSEKPGWRMFRVDRIEGKINYLAGGEKKDKGHKVFDNTKKFIDSNRPKYNPNDKDLNNIIISLTPKEVEKTLNEEYLNKFYKIINI